MRSSGRSRRRSRSASESRQRAFSSCGCEKREAIWLTWRARAGQTRIPSFPNTGFIDFAKAFRNVTFVEYLFTFFVNNIYLINYIFKSGPAPDPLCVGDANGDDTINIGDAVYLINYIFKGGLAPVEDCCP